MAMIPAGSPGTVTVQRRPTTHFTPRTGWINDPYGVHWDGEVYHLYYQYLPDRTTWSPECRWGHAVSPDLVHWTESTPVLTPAGSETGCWSGAVVPSGPGGPLAFYTRMRADDAGLSQIAVARPVAGSAWSSDLTDVAIPGPPPDLDITAFRDPFVWARGEGGADGWAMVVGAGRADGSGAVLLYTSDDLTTWRYRSVLCTGFADDGRPGHSEVWECPQLVQVDGRWVLVVSVMEDALAHHVATAVGHFDGETFTHTGWSTLAHGDLAYATSVFRDRDGRACMVSWLQESPDHDPASSPRSGAHSAPAVLRVDPAGGVTITPHPDLRTALTTDASTDASAARLVVLAPGATLDIPAATDGVPPTQVRLTAPDRVEVRDGRGVTRVLPADGRTVVEVLVDADIVELYAGASYGAWRTG